LLVEKCSLQAMIDLSDGLDNDLRRILRASNVGARVDVDLLPLNTGCDWQQAVSEGEDYGLLIVLDEAVALTIDDVLKEDSHRLYRVGEITASPTLDYQQNSNSVTLDKKPFSYS